jgi:hypothetical protein
MKPLDVLLQKWRMRMAIRHLPESVRLIDIGAHNGEIFEALGARLKEGFGIEPLLASPRQTANYRLEPGYFPQVLPQTTGWDAITMLAVLEHIPPAQQQLLADACWKFLRPGGLVIVTVPAPAVDHILFFLTSMKLLSGMSLEEHFGFEPEQTRSIFGEPRFRLLVHSCFQLGLNHLFVFSKEGA